MLKSIIPGGYKTHYYLKKASRWPCLRSDHDQDLAAATISSRDTFFCYCQKSNRAKIYILFLLPLFLLLVALDDTMASWNVAPNSYASCFSYLLGFQDPCRIVSCIGENIALSQPCSNQGHAKVLVPVRAKC